MKHKLRVLLWVLVPFLLAAQSLQEFERRVTEFTLPNGLHFIVLERHEAPVVSFHTCVNAGSVDDPGGKTGLAHMFEHMAFKGTQTIGTKNYAEEKKAMDAIEAVYDKLDAEQDPGIRSDPKKIEALHAELKAAIDKAAGYVDENAYVRIIEENGGVGLNAGTGEDSTDYFYSLPANRMELWFPLESQRFRDPIYREFYKERDVVRDKRIALAAMAQSSFPGSKYPNVFLLYEVPSVGHTVEENEKACYEVLERPKTEKVDDETLNRVKTKIRASVIRGLDSNPGMAGQLTFYCVNYGDWRKLFTGIEDIHKVTAEDVHRVARRYFTNESRTVAWTSRPQTAAQGAGK